MARSMLLKGMNLMKRLLVLKLIFVTFLPSQALAEQGNGKRIDGYIGLGAPYGLPGIGIIFTTGKNIFTAGVGPHIGNASLEYDEGWRESVSWQYALGAEENGNNAIGLAWFPSSWGESSSHGVYIHQSWGATYSYYLKGVREHGWVVTAGYYEQQEDHYGQEHRYGNVGIAFKW